MSQVTIERYVVKSGMHLGPLRRSLSVDSIIEWEPETETMKIDGVRVDRRPGIEPSEAMRMLKALNSRHPNNLAIEPLEMTQGTGIEVSKLSTSTLCVLPILGCLVASKQYLKDKHGIPSEMSPVSDEQSQFLKMFADLMDDIPSITELEYRANEDEKPINKWLRERGFSIQLDPVSSDGFATASIFDILLKWLHEGKKTEITGRGNTNYSGVKIKKGVVISHMVAVHPHPVVRIATQSGDTVCMSMVDDMTEDRFGIFLKVADLEKVKATSHNYDGVAFPMIDLDHKPDISWICGLTVGGKFYVSQALQQTKFRMNEIGARAQSAAAMTLRKCAAGPGPHIIDRPFLLWIQRPGMKFPLFAALLCEDVWKEPREL